MIKLSVGVGVGAMIGRAAAALARLIPQFNGTDNYATLDTPITFTGDFEVEFDFTVMTAAGVGSGILGNFASALAIDFLQLQTTASKMVIDTSDGNASIVETGFLDGSNHSAIAYRTGSVVGIKVDTVVIISKDLTTISDVTYDLIGAMSIAASSVVNILKGHILSVKFTDNSGTPVVTEHILDTKTPTGLTYTNVTDVDWHNYKFNTPLDRWDYQGSGIAGSQLMQFEGTATTPLSSSITVTGSTWEMNWEGLWVEHYISGAGAYTYLSAPDGVPMRCNIEVMDDVTAYSMINEKTTVQSVDNALAAFAESVTRVPRVCDVTLTGNSIPTSAGLANKAIIEAEGGTVLVDS